MVVCKFWQQGNCRRGNACTFEHPNDQPTSQFGSNQGSFSSRGAFGNTGQQNQTLTVNPDDVRADLTTNRPNWILSSYGPGKDPPTSLFIENEFSPEEIRARFYQQQNAGNAQVADQEAINLWTKADKDMQDAAAKANDINKFLQEQAEKHPNRYDFCKVDGKKSRDEILKETGSATTTATTMGSFGANPNPFSRPAFGQSTFGQPSQPSTQSAFGKPAFGTAGGTTAANPNPFSKPAFGAPGFGQPAQPAPAFGSSGFPQSSSAFGKPANPTSSFGQPSSTSSPFAKPTAASTTTTSAFGQPAFGSASTPQSTFGQQRSTTGTSAFGQPLNGTATNAFGQPGAGSGPSPFGQAQGSTGTSGFGQAQAGTGSSTFGQPQGSTGTGSFGQQGNAGTSAFGQQQSGPTTASPFGQIQSAQTQSTGFGQSTQQSKSGFGTSSPFGAPKSSAFGQSTASPFGQQASSSPFGAGATTSAFGSGGGFKTGGAFGQPAAPESKTVDMDAAPTDTSLTPASGFGTSAAVQPAFGGPSTIAQSQPTVRASEDSNPFVNSPQAPLHYSETLGPLNMTFGPNRQPIQYRGQRVIIHEKEEAKISGVVEVVDRIPTYQRPDTRKDERIWFPQGNKDEKVENVNRAVDHFHDLEGIDDQYTEEVLKQFQFLFHEGKWKDHKIPLIPPKREWIKYDF